MRGSVVGQVDAIFRLSGINQIGESRHGAKDAARTAGARTSTQIAQKTGVHSYNTADSYRAVWRACFQHARDQHGVKDITSLSAQHVQSFIRSKIDQGVARATFGQYSAALGKLETALRMYADQNGIDRQYEFRPAIQEVRADAATLSRFDNSNVAIRDPARVAAGIEREDYRLAARIQSEAGTRISETTRIRADQLRGDGRIEVEGKGGKVRTVEVSRETYRDLEQRISRGEGEFKVSRSGYDKAVRAAIRAAGDNPAASSHSFRYTWAQERMAELREEGKPFKEALAIVSQELGHNRADITLHYLGGR